jgi:hypothetical protein
LNGRACLWLRASDELRAEGDGGPPCLRELRETHRSGRVFSPRFAPRRARDPS